ncbi:MAG: hypothetical protein ABJ246_01070 [Paracoccaceae bacterium]
MTFPNLPSLPQRIPLSGKNARVLGYVIGAPAKSGQHDEIHLDGTLPISDFAPEVETPIRDDKDVDDDSWWQQESDDDV